MSAVEMQIAGFGGQGVILAGMTIGRGLTLYDGYHVSLTQSFGPEARGSACSAQLIVSREPVLYPYLSQPHILVAMSQEGYRKFSPNVRPGGLLLIEEDLVRPGALDPGVRLHGVPATRLAEELGRKMILNMVMVGFFTAITGLLRPESARRAVAESVPHGTEALNQAAFDKGYNYGMAQLAEGPGEAQLAASLLK
ncbi:MAG TPA: 2-oxoacid:acceptor oxidoreductase family protein [Candidatus Acidoferrales bacterium]|nr:2-oxoacid:acceptor oxidoreductase family protein [Candidatus Acidoferrales bacterium]